jgi:hypothetical protein
VDRLHPVAARALCGVERSVSRAEQELGLAGIVGQHRDPERCRDAAIDAWDGDLGDSDAQLLRRLESTGAVGVRQYDGELLATEAPTKSLARTVLAATAPSTSSPLP